MYPAPTAGSRECFGAQFAMGVTRRLCLGLLLALHVLVGTECDKTTDQDDGVQHGAKAGGARVGTRRVGRDSGLGGRVASLWEKTG